MAADNSFPMGYPAFSNAMKVLITSPSLYEYENVSGISTMISAIIEHTACDFTHFVAGRKDADGFDVNWVLAQLQIPLKFRNSIATAKPDVIHINTAFEPRSIIRDLILAKAAGRDRPVVVHVHGGRFVLQEFSNSTLASLARNLLRTASRVIVLSETEATGVRKLVPDLKTTILPNAVAAESFAVPAREWRTKNIIYLGRLHESKGLNDIIESCRMLGTQGFKFRFSCYGAGPDQERFVAAMKEMLGDNFHFGGVVSGEEKVRALSSADIFLMPSKFEGLPLSLLEAMAAGCIPIVSNRGSMTLVVDDGRNGFLVEPGDLTQIVGKLKFLLSESETGWNEIRQSAHKTIVDGYDMAQYSEKLEDLYAELVAGSGRSDSEMN